MNEMLIKYSITPRVVRVGDKTKITVFGLDKSCEFLDGVDYVVKIIQKNQRSDYRQGESLMTFGRKNCVEIVTQSKNGVLEFEYVFNEEDEWKINIGRREIDSNVPYSNGKYEKWPWLKENLLRGFDFNIYSLNDDLYYKRPYKGDLHIHTYDSDGQEGPKMAAAQYRKWGYDFISITDHYCMWPSFDTIKDFEEINTNFKIFPGEEVHPFIGCVFHMVNFNGKTSVNELALNEPEKVNAEVEAIAKTLNYSDSNTAMEIAWFKWIYDEIHKAGGIAIYPHPFWVIFDSLNLSEEVSKEVLKNKLCDAVEFIGGTERRDNMVQRQWWTQQFLEGYKYPIVGSTDSHSSLTHGYAHFDDSFTIVFAEDKERIPENILSGNTVAVDNFKVDDKNVYGQLRMVKYAWFLIENYYDMHDSLCNASGQAILRYVFGDKTQNELIKKLEEEIEKYDKTFFGA